MIRIKDLYFSIGNFELKIPELDFEKGKIYRILGENGAGKTTLLRLICGLYRQGKGSIEIMGRPNFCDQWLCKAGIYLDESFLIDYLTPMEFIEFKSLFYNIDKERVRKFVEKVNKNLSCNLFSNEKLIRELSHGNRKKTGIFSVFLHTPEIVILDEPFENLDERGRTFLQKMLFDRLEDKTVIITVHHSVEFSHYTDTAVIDLTIKDGEVRF